MSDFDTDERSVSGSRPVDLYVIATPTQTFNLTSYVADVVYQGVTYTATTMSRGTQQVAQDLTGREFLVYLPITHPLVQRYAAFGIPQREVVVTLLRLQSTSGAAFQQATGFGQALSIDGHVAVMRVPSIMDDAMKVRLPTVSAQRPCNHVLYDRQCTVDRVTASGIANITAISGNTITTNSSASGTQLQFGEVEHIASGEKRMILVQSGNVLTLNLPFVEARLSDQVILAPGCDHAIVTCRDKFSNVVNFGGLPHMNLNGSANPWAIGGLGIVVQS